MAGTAVSSLETTFKSRKANNGMEAGNHVHAGLWLFSGGDDDTSIGSSHFRESWAVARGRMLMAAVLYCMLCCFWGSVPTSPQELRLEAGRCDFIADTAITLETEGEMSLVTMKST